MRQKKRRCKVGDSWINEKGARMVVTSLTEKGSGIISCSICDRDRELFPTGSITTYYKEQTTCGCAVNTFWKQEQYLVLVKRKCEEKGFIFHNFILGSKDYITGKTKLLLEDISSGHTWDTTDILHLIHSEQGCPYTGRDNANKIRRKSDQDFIQDFLSAGSYVEGHYLKEI